MDRHANTKRERKGRKEGDGGEEYKRTCHVYGQTRQYEKGQRERGRETRPGNEATTRKGSASAPVTSMDRHTSTK